MGLPEDLKNYRAGDGDGFQLIDPQTAGALLYGALIVALILERAGLL
jgi:hypothetical protein